MNSGVADQRYLTVNSKLFTANCLLFTRLNNGIFYFAIVCSCVIMLPVHQLEYLMSKKKKERKEKTAVSLPLKPYQKPTIIYEGYVSTRAGSPIQQPNEGEFNIIDYLLGKGS